MTRIAINGLGRIGRRVMRLLVERRWMHGQAELAAINDPLPADQLAHLLRQDSLHGRAAFEVASAKSSAGLPEDDLLLIDGREVPCLSIRTPVEALPWTKLGVNVVIEATGMLARNERALHDHLRAGAHQVLVTAMCPPSDLVCVPGVNHDRYLPERHQIISTGAALTQAIAPVLASLCHGGYGIQEGSITLLQCPHPTLPVLDRASKHCWREGRAMHNLIPGSHGGGCEVSLALPELRGRLMSSMFLVPVPGVCAVSMVLRLGRETPLADVLATLRLSAGRELQGLLHCSDDPIVSSDVLGETHSAVMAMKDAIATSRHLISLPLFYDPETGYASRVLDALEFVMKRSSHL